MAETQRECERCRTGNPPVAKFCMACGNAITDEPARAGIGTGIGTGTGTGGLRFVTAFFCDIAGSTELAARLDPEAWHAVLDRYFTAARTAVEAVGGRVEKFIGDAVVAVFGADTGAEDDAASAVHAALGTIDRLAAHDADLRRFGVSLTLRFGIASGQAVVAERDSSFAIGVMMNRAARLQSAAPPGEVLIDIRTWLLVRGLITCRPVDPVPAKGFDSALQAWRVSRSGPGRPAQFPFVNQGPLLADAVAIVDGAVAAGCPRTLVLSGEVGSGKTRILRKLEVHLSGRAAPAVRLVRVECARDDAQYGRVRLLRLDEDLQSLRSNPADRARPAQSAAPSTAELLWRARRRLAELTRTGPLAVLIDNAQWASADLLSLCAGHTAGSGPLVFVLAGREVPAAVPADAVVMPVPRLTPAHSAELLGLFHAERDLELHHLGLAADTIVERSGGNPLFLEQLAALAGEGLDDLVAPSAVAALGARISRLDTAARGVLACVGAWGCDIAAGDLASTCGLDEPGLNAALDLLDVARLSPLVPAAPARRRFGCHSAAQVAYAQTGLADRAALHTRIAQRYQQRARREPAALGPAMVHAERALSCRQAIEPGSAAAARAAHLAAGCLAAEARRAIGCSEVQRAADLAVRARALGLGDPALRLEIAAIETYALGACGRAAQALARIDEVRATVDEEANLTAAVHLRANEMALRPGADADAGAMEELGRRASCPEATARVALQQALRAIRDGDYPKAQTSLETAREATRSGPAGPGTAEIYGNLSLVLAYGDAELGGAVDECLKLRAEVEDAPVLHSVVSCSAALLLRMAGERDAARLMADEAQAVFSGMGHAAGSAGLAEFRATIAEFDGDLPAAAAANRQAARSYARNGQDMSARRCLLKAWLLDPAAADRPESAPAAGGRIGSWESSVMEHQWNAGVLSAAGDAAGAAVALERAVAVIGSVRGAGAVLLPLACCARMAGQVGAAPLAEEIDGRISAALATRNMAWPKRPYRY